jgi:hypothetical protein
MRSLFLTFAAVSLAGLALADPPVIDGIEIDAAHWNGPAVAIQDTNTHFGDNFNELDQMFVDSDDDNIYIGLTGNLWDNNALTIFLDVDDMAGNNPLSIQPPPEIPCVGEFPRLLRYYHGTTLDAGFTPDYGLTISVGIFPGQSGGQFVYACDLTDLNTLDVTILGLGAADTGDGSLTQNMGIEVALDNSNTGGVGNWDEGATPGDTGNDPTDATTGIEVLIPRGMIGLDQQTPTEIRIFPFISDNATGTENPGACGLRAWGSNQGLNGFAGADNLGLFNGADTTLDFTAVANVNYVAVVIPGAP